MSTPKQIATLLRSIADVLDGEIVAQVEEGLETEVEQAKDILEMRGEQFIKDFDSAVFGNEDQSEGYKRSNCCKSQVVTVSGEDGTAYYKCISCGDACDWHDKRTPPPIMPPVQKKRAKRDIVHKCCGSCNWKHKKGCTGATVGTSSESEEDHGIEQKEIGSSRYECDDCAHDFFHAVYDGNVIVCPECKGTNVWPVKVV